MTGMPRVGSAMLDISSSAYAGYRCHAEVQALASHHQFADAGLLAHCQITAEKFHSTVRLRCVTVAAQTGTSDKRRVVLGGP